MNTNNACLTRARGGVARLIITVVCLFATSVAHGALPAEINRGIAWLAGQVQGDGRLVDENASIAAPLQARAEVHETLKRATTLPGVLTTAIIATPDENTEYLARGILTRVAAGLDSSAKIARLSARRNTDGGYGGDVGYASNPLDTAWALLAHKTAGNDDGVADGLAYLQGAQNQNGAYRVDDRPDAYVTAIVLQSLRAHASRYDLSLQTGRAVAYLQSIQNADGTWSGDTVLTAQAYLALHDYVDYEPLATRIKEIFNTRQTGAGDWEGDSYVTALVLRALLSAMDAPANPSLGVLQGAVVDARTGLPIHGASATLNPPSGLSAITNMDGIFVIRDIPVGTNGLTISLEGYGSLSLSVQVGRGETKSLGTILLQPAPAVSTGLIRGTASDAYSGQILQGVLVSVLGAPQSATTGLNGTYQIINVPAGDVRVLASKSGYTSVTAGGTITAGGVLLFSPVMAPGTAAETALEGRASDAVTGVHLPGVLITASGAGTFSATTGVDGKYRIAGLIPGTYTVTAAYNGYVASVAMVTITDRATSFYSPMLVPIGMPTPATAKITGIVKDAGKDTPIADADISLIVAGIGVLTARGNQYGSFSLDNPGGDTAVLKIEKAGYKTAFIQIYIQPGSSLSVGEIRLIAVDASDLLPDFRIKTVQRQNMSTDPHSLQLSGSIGAVIENAGHAVTAQNSHALAFYDADMNAVYDAGADVKLGETGFGALLPGQSMAIQIALHGNLPYRDAPVRVWVDSGQTTPEIHEDNNVASTTTAEECTIGRTLLFDDFNDGIADGWSPLNYNNTPATIINGEYVRTGYGSSWTGDMSWRDYRAEIKLRFPNGMINDGGLVFRAYGTSVGEWLQVTINDGLVRFFDGTSVIAATYIPTSTDPNFWYTISAEVLGRNARIDVNDQTLFNVNDLHWDNGAVGTVQDGVLVHYDDLRVTGVTGPHDISTARLRLVDKGAMGTEVTFRVGNGGSSVIPAGTQISFFTNDVGDTTYLGSVYLDQPLELEQWRDLSWTFVGDLGAASRLIVVADADATGQGRLTECDEANNRTDIALTPANIAPDFSFDFTLDKSSYPANSNVGLSAYIDNTGRYLGEVGVAFAIETTLGVGVAGLPSVGPVSLGAGDQIILNGQWNTGTTYSGTYQAKAIFFDPQGRELGRRTVPFGIVGGQAVLATQLATDKSTYAQNEMLRITGRVLNASANTLLGGLRMNERLHRPDGTSIDLGTRALPALPPGASSDQAFLHRLDPAPAGTYTVTQTVLDVADVVLDTRQTHFVVSSGAMTGAGLAGTLLATPASVAAGEKVTLRFNVGNTGNSAFNGLRLNVAILDAANQSVLATYPYTTHLALRGNYADQAVWQSPAPTRALGGRAQAGADPSYVAVLDALVNGKTLTLAQVNFAVSQPTASPQPAAIPSLRPGALVLLGLLLWFAARRQYAPWRQQ